MWVSDRGKVNHYVCMTACVHKIICCAGFHAGSTIDLLMSWLRCGWLCLSVCVFPAGLQAAEESWCCPDEPGSAVGGGLLSPHIPLRAFLSGKAHKKILPAHAVPSQHHPTTMKWQGSASHLILHLQSVPPVRLITLQLIQDLNRHQYDLKFKFNIGIKMCYCWSPLVVLTVSPAPSCHQKLHALSQ